MKIFINYRRGRSDGITGRIDDRLREAFGHDSVFRDIEDIPLGKDFYSYINQQIDDSRVFLALIGPEWQPERMCDDPDDFVRREIESALNLDILSIPLLVDGASSPPKSNVPPTVAPLFRRNGLSIDAGRRFESDMQALVNQLNSMTRQAGPSKFAVQRVFPEQWHLRPVYGANVKRAWEFSRGENTTIAIPGTGIDIDHREFSSPGKICLAWDIEARTADPRPRENSAHDTAYAGVACADGRFGASGVAPAARLMPVRFTGGLGSVTEEQAILYAVDNGADVIGITWGPPQGNWWDPNDPVHFEVYPLPGKIKRAFDYATQHGRNGLGCILVLSAGNGNASIDNDGYASYENGIAIGACNDRQVRSVYSGKGDSLWAVFPSGDATEQTSTGIWTTDISGPTGYNPGDESLGDAAGDYTNSFTGTSAAAAGAAGVAALVLACNPELRWDEVKEVLRRCCTPIDDSGHEYDANGHSRAYGYGRLDARRAVELALRS